MIGLLMLLGSVEARRTSAQHHPTLPTCFNRSWIGDDASERFRAQATTKSVLSWGMNHQPGGALIFQREALLGAFTEIL